MPSESTPDPLIRAIDRAYSRGPAPEPERLAAVLRTLERAAAVKGRPARPGRWLPWLLAGAVAAAAAAGGWRWYEQLRVSPPGGEASSPVSSGPMTPATSGSGSEGQSVPGASRAAPVEREQGKRKGHTIFMQ